jgi:hypothetical protein
VADNGENAVCVDELLRHRRRLHPGPFIVDANERERVRSYTTPFIDRLDGELDALT